MSGFYNRRAERQRKERDTPERIVTIARAKGSFEVSLRYRDSWLRKRCGDLRSQGLLTGGARQGDRLVFYPVANPPPSTEQA